MILLQGLVSFDEEALYQKQTIVKYIILGRILAVREEIGYPTL